MSDFLNEIIELSTVTKSMSIIREDVEKASIELAATVLAGGTIYIIGNGGSATEASHFSGEILGRYKKERKGLPAVALTTDLATITAVANDYGYEAIFERQLEGLFKPGKDTLITLSTSGNSDNIVRAVDYIQEVGGYIINLVGGDGGMVTHTSKNNNKVINIIVPSANTPRIQEMHLLILHYFAKVVESEYVSKRGF